MSAFDSDSSDSASESKTLIPESTPEERGPSTHPTFAEHYANADVTLQSEDNVLFPISSQTLCRASGWFRTMFSLPQGSQPPDNTEPISMSEPSEILGGLLSIISGIDLPALDDIDFVEPLLFAAEKYDMPLPIAIIRVALVQLRETFPVRVYGIACRMSWEAEARDAATRTLEIDIMGRDNKDDLAHIESRHLLKLLSLHERRRREVAEALESTDDFVANLHGVRCNGRRDGVVCDELVDHTTWWAFKLAWNREPWRFVALREQIVRSIHMPELEALLDDRCGRCKKDLYSRQATLDNLRDIAAELPHTIEWP